MKSFLTSSFILLYPKLVLRKTFFLLIILCVLLVSFLLSKRLYDFFIGTILGNIPDTANEVIFKTPPEENKFFRKSDDASEIIYNAINKTIIDTYPHTSKPLNQKTKKRNLYHVWSRNFLKKNKAWNYRNLTKSEINQLSVLGKRLFLHESVGSVSTRTFLINIYKFGKLLDRRLIHHYSLKNVDPFENCSVKNCRISYEDSDFHAADAVLFHLHRIEYPPINIKRRNFNQRWVWLSDEAVFNTFYSAKDRDLSHYNNLFNWSMTYRSTSDVPVPYGRTIPFGEKHINISDIFFKKSKSVAILGSNCGGQNNRWQYVKELQKHINVTTFGHCGTEKCPGQFNEDCQKLNDFKFYLAFENSNCFEYITEKVSSYLYTAPAI